jgi:hypothetical protein
MKILRVNLAKEPTLKSLILIITKIPPFPPVLGPSWEMDDNALDAAWHYLENALHDAIEVANGGDRLEGLFRALDPRCFQIVAAAGLFRVLVKYLVELLTENLQTCAAPKFCATIAEANLAEEGNEEKVGGKIFGVAGMAVPLSAGRKQNAIVMAVQTAALTLERCDGILAELFVGMRTAFKAGGGGFIDDDDGDDEVELRTLQLELRRKFATAVFKLEIHSSLLSNGVLFLGDSAVAASAPASADDVQLQPFGALLWMLQITMRHAEACWRNVGKRGSRIAEDKVLTGERKNDDVKDEGVFDDLLSEQQLRYTNDNEYPVDESEDFESRVDTPDGIVSATDVLSINDFSVRAFFCGLRLLGWLELPFFERATAGVVFAAIEREVGSKHHRHGRV